MNYKIIIKLCLLFPIAIIWDVISWLCRGVSDIAIILDEHATRLYNSAIEWCEK
jgi:hypothetical protein